MSIFVYGHTHEMKFPWTCELYDAQSSQITVVNSGAFQRLLSKEGYLKRAAKLPVLRRD